jgi:hypothetical protein
LIDKPNPGQQTKYDSFKTGYPYLFTNGQVFELSKNMLEEYYPAPYTKTAEETKRLQEEKEKVNYAKKVGNEISKESFEGEMSIIFEALEACNNKSFNPK